MTPTEKKEIIDGIVSAVNANIDEKTKSFYIDREEHYNHHQFVKAFKGGVEACQSTIGKVGLTSLVVGTITVIVWGFVGWIRKQIGG